MTYNRKTQVYRNTRNAKIMGVCAGIADYLDVNPTIVRVMYVIGTIFTGVWPGFFLYILLGFLLKPMPRDLYQSDHEETFWRNTRKQPDVSAAELRRRFRDLERRTSDMEEEVTSKRFKLERELNKL